MLDARRDEEWWHTAAIIAWQLKSQLGKKGQRLEAKHFHPYSGTRKSQQPKKTKAEIIANLNAMVGITKNG